VGSAIHTARGEMRLGLSATAAAAVLYGAVVLLGLGPASPAAVGSNDDRFTPVVHVQHDSVVSGPVQRLPQVSAGPARHHSRRARRVVTVSASPRPNLLPQGPGPAATAGPASSPQHSEPLPTAPQPLSLPSVASPAPAVIVPAVEIPALPTPPPEPEALLPSPPTLPSVSLP
jgi:hypothetical protein